ncbi:MAG: glycosyltransferase family 2 protein [Acidimicrobiia bacterium]|nr:glycosyltransferase family 2 protein [Acidimicrobiia bacterium]
MGSSGEIILMVYKSRQVLPAFMAEVGSTLPIVLVDNSYHEDDISDLLSDYPNVRRVDSGGNIGFSAAANLGARIATSPILVFMNPDTRPAAATLTSLIAHLDNNPDLGAAGVAGIGTAGGGAQPTLRRVLAHATGWSRRSPLGGVFFQELNGRRVDAEWIAGSCLAIRREAFESVGGFDPEYPIYMSDFDLGRRLKRAGYRQRILGDLVVPHDDGGSSDLPMPWTWERRSRAWVRFLRHTRSLPVALGISAILAVGYAGRIVVYTTSGQWNRSREQRTYLRSMLSEWVRPTTATLSA